MVTLRAALAPRWRDPAQFAGYRGDAAGRRRCCSATTACTSRLQIDRSHPIGRDDPAGIADVVLEAAVTTIQDCEDSIAAVDAADKVGAYRNWLGLMKGTLARHVREGRQEADPPPHDRSTLRRPVRMRARKPPWRHRPLTLHGRSLMLIRNVGLHMHTDAVLDADGAEIPEGILDAAITSLIAHARPARHREAAQLACRLGLHRQAEDARSAGGGVHRHVCSAASRRCSAWRPIR